MGTSTSAQVLTQQEAEAICAERFGTSLVVKESLGIVRTGVIKKQALNMYEEEVCNIFNRYCPNGTMNVVVWVKFCKDSKLFSRKKKFLLPDAHIVFQKAFFTKGDDASDPLPTRRTSLLSAIVKPGREHDYKEGDRQRTVHYTSFRFVMLLEVAVHKRINIDTLLQTITMNHTPKKLKSINETRDTTDSSPSAKANVRYELNFHHQRDRYLQQARRILKKLERVPKADTLTQQKRQALYQRVGSVTSEDKLQAIFMSYSCFNKGCKLMGIDDFLQMCQGCELIQRDFQTRDARLVFSNALVLASSPSAGKALNNSVVDCEYMMYSVFRSFAIPHIAEKKKKNCSDVIELFI